MTSTFPDALSHAAFTPGSARTCDGPPASSKQHLAKTEIHYAYQNGFSNTQNNPFSEKNMPIHSLKSYDDFGILFVIEMQAIRTLKAKTKAHPYWSSRKII